MKILHFFFIKIFHFFTYIYIRATIFVNETNKVTPTITTIQHAQQYNRH